MHIVIICKAENFVFTYAKSRFSHDKAHFVPGNSERGDVITAICGDRNPYHVISQGRYLFLTFQTTHQNFENWKGVELLFEVFGMLFPFSSKYLYLLFIVFNQF